jgi:hypothetical protein
VGQQQTHVPAGTMSVMHNGVVGVQHST